MPSRSERILEFASKYPRLFRWTISLSRKGVLPFFIFDHWLSNQIARRVGLGAYHAHWQRIVMYEECFKWVRALDPSSMSLLEISPGPNEAWRELGFKSSARVDYPEFDICSQVLHQKFDFICADQVFEHLLWPYRAGKHIYEMLNPGGYALLLTPFLLRVHPSPSDCSRWTETGLKQLLAECGFRPENIRTGSWGNRSCVVSDLRTDGNWTYSSWWRSLKNDPLFPVAVWALARKETGISA
jgi:SAM-dependent methyltransferase